jgi:hypothetical protein
VRTLAAIATVALGLAAARPAAAQSGAVKDDGVPLVMELRVGALWPRSPVIVEPDDDDPSTTRPAVGGRLGLYFGNGTLERRLSLQIAVDWAELGSIEFVDEALGSGARTEGHWFAVVPALGIDVVRRPRMSLDVRAGPAILVDLTTFLLQRHDPDFDESDFDNVCDLVAFKDRCSERIRAGGAVGFGARYVVKPSWKLFVGFDYTRFTVGRNVLVATVGRDTR